MPKKPSTSFLFFSQENNQKLMKDKKLKLVMAAKETGQIWKGMTDKQKQPYVKLADQDVKRFEKQTKEM